MKPHGAKTKVSMGSKLSEKFLIQVVFIKDLCYRYCFLKLHWM